jgi:quercetin dioxygenase-like cupin family protein
MHNKVKKAEVHEKKWGSEHWIENNDKYCGKLLNFNKGAKFSMHFHALKDETWYVLKGQLECILIDTTDASKETLTLSQGDVLRIKPLLPHRLIAKEESTIIEISTQHFEDDSYRVATGDSQS